MANTRIDYDSRVISFTVLDLVRRLAAVGGTQQEIGDWTGVPHRTLQRRLAEKGSAIREAYQAGIKDRNDSLTRMLFVAARAGNVVAMIWLTKNLLGWRDKAELDIRSVVTQLAALDDHDLEALSHDEPEPELGDADVEH